MAKSDTPFHADRSPETESPCLNDAAVSSVKARTVAVTGVGLLRLIHIAQRRVRYLARYAYWTCKHGSTANAAWVCAMEGYTW